MPNIWDRIKATFSKQSPEAAPQQVSAETTVPIASPVPDTITSAQAYALDHKLAEKAKELLEHIRCETESLHTALVPLIEAKHPIIRTIFPILQAQDVSMIGQEVWEGESQETAVAKYLHQPRDIWRLFPVEDNLGIFEEMMPYTMIDWREKDAFGEIASSRFVGMAELCDYAVDKTSDRYMQYKNDYPYFCAKQILMDGLGRYEYAICRETLIGCDYSPEQQTDSTLTHEEYGRLTDRSIRELDNCQLRFDKTAERLREYVQGISVDRTAHANNKSQTHARGYGR